MNEVRNHKDLEVWKVSMDFVIEVYHITKALNLITALENKLTSK